MARLVIDPGKLSILFLTTVFFVILSAPVATFGQAEQPSENGFDSIEALIEILKAKGVVTEEEAVKFIKRYREEPPSLTRKKEERVIMIVPEEQEEEIADRVSESVNERVKKDVDALGEEVDIKTEDLLRRTSENSRSLRELENKVNEDLANKVYKASWAQRIRFGGDVRLRYQADYFDENNAILLDPSEPTEIINTTKDRHRFRYRARISMKAQVLDPREDVNVGKVEIGGRLSTGNEENPVSTNDTLGDYQNKDSVVFDRVYLKWTYSPEEMVWEGKIPEFSISGGRIPNPWFYTDLVWDSDVNFEGVAANLQTDTLMSNPWSAFVTLGAFSIQEVELSSQDKWLYAGQVGVERKKLMGLSGKLGVAYYEYDNIVGERNDALRPNERDYTAPQFQQRGNALMDIDPSDDELFALASDYELLNITGQLDYSYWFPVHCILTADYVKNLGFDRDKVAARIGLGADVPSGLDTGYQIKLKTGYPEPSTFGEWNVSLAYKYLEGDAVLDAFTDSDFHGGGTNAEGWILGAELGLFKDVWLSTKWMSTDEIDGPPLAIDTFQVDVNSRF